MLLQVGASAAPVAPAAAAARRSEFGGDSRTPRSSRRPSESGLSIRRPSDGGLSALMTDDNPGSPPSDLNELAAYTRREREKFEALAEAHQERMRTLMSTSIPLSPGTPAARGAREGGSTPSSVGKRLEDVQRHFESHRQQQQRIQSAY